MGRLATTQVLEEEADNTLSELRAYTVGFWGTWIFHVGVELGLFQALSDGALQPEELAERRGYELRFVEVWCEAAREFGFLEVAGTEGYVLSDEVGAGRMDMGPWIKTYIGIAQRVYASLEAVFLGRALPEPRINLFLLLQDGLKRAYRWLWETLPVKVPELNSLLHEGCRLIEFGCGTGVGLSVVRELYPNVDITGVEGDYDCAREAESVTKGVIVLGTPEECRYVAKFDLAIFHRSLSYCNDPCLALRKAITSLKPGGWLVVATRAAEYEGASSQGKTRTRLQAAERFFYRMFMAPCQVEDVSWKQVRLWCRQEGLESVIDFEAPDHGSPALVYRKSATL